MTSEVLSDGDFKGHVGSDMGGCGEVNEGFRIGQIHDEGSDCWIGQLVKCCT